MATRRTTRSPRLVTDDILQARDLANCELRTGFVNCWWEEVAERARSESEDLLRPRATYILDVALVSKSNLLNCHPPTIAPRTESTDSVGERRAGWRVGQLAVNHS